MGRASGNKITKESESTEDWIVLVLVDPGWRNYLHNCSSKNM
jgi:hypothetical protein